MPLLRLIDANANRAREGLRLLEDTARFVLNDADLSRACKEVRHELTACVELLVGSGGTPALLAARDTPGDVGTTIATPTELHRESLASIVHAAGGRVGEALRTLEEAAKVQTHAAAASRLEAARYRAYDIHRRLALMLGGTARKQFRLCVLLTKELCTHRSLLDVARFSLEGGADCLQLREKSMADGELLALAMRLASMAREHGAAVFVNDRVDIALLSGAHGVHVGQTDLPPARVRQVCGSRLLVGVSTSSLEEALAAVRGGADLCGVGPIFPTTTKHKPMLAGPAYLRAYLADDLTSRVPHLAISGITPANIHELAAAGCRGVAVSSAVCGAHDPGAVCRDLCEALAATYSPA